LRLCVKFIIVDVFKALEVKMETHSLDALNKVTTSLHKELKEDLAQVKSVKDLEPLKIKYQGRKGALQNLMKELKEIPTDLRPMAGKWINDLKEEAEQLFANLEEKLISIEEQSRLENENIDITLPGRRRFLGRKHPVLQLFDDVVETSMEMGFSVQYSPDIETDYYNFESLNYPKDHPARDMQDTFYISNDLLLKTHTTSIQVRIMESQTPPIRIVCPGKCYRNEEITARSHVFFHQLDALYIDKNVTFGDLLSTMEQFFTRLLGSEAKMRFRPSYFPFVEPGMEVDIHCIICKGNGCNVCKHTGWLEVAGAGMVHPEVLRNGGIDPEIYSGFAWGMGLERLVMVKHGIRDIRLFTQNDMRFLEQFP
jgi:phenylalanyl-tRNA synthetase alpha chain